jgi:hypothetical protein
MAVTVNKRFNIKQGDLLPVLEGRIIDRETGKGQSLDGATLEFHMKDEEGTVLISAPADIVGDQLVEEEMGYWKYEWQAGDTGPYSATERLIFEGEIQATFAGKPLTGPNTGNFKIIMAPEID